jgi:hypothetical protein
MLIFRGKSYIIYEMFTSLFPKDSKKIASKITADKLKNK